MSRHIRKQDPLKQGLKRDSVCGVFVSPCNSKARSTKTRIETTDWAGNRYVSIIRKQDPLKQGLKLAYAHV